MSFYLNMATFSPPCPSSTDLLSNRGRGEALCLVLGEEVSKQLVWQSALRPPVYHSDCLIQPKYMAPSKGMWGHVQAQLAES